MTTAIAILIGAALYGALAWALVYGVGQIERAAHRLHKKGATK